MSLLNTDMGREQDHMARFLHMAKDYARKQGFKGTFFIEPKPMEPTTHQYDFDAAACLNFIRAYGLEDRVKLNIETNHATLAGHTMMHELIYASIQGALGSIDANTGRGLVMVFDGLPDWHGAIVIQASAVDTSAKCYRIDEFEANLARSVN